MFTTLLTAVTNFIVQVIAVAGYGGVAALMAIESAAIPLPSEIIMPFAGFLVSQGRFSLLGVSLAGGLGSVIGSVITYAIGRFGGRPLIERYGRYVLITKHDLDQADRFFARFGSWATFLGRLLPVVRTFISVPAGIARVNIVQFIIYTFVGSVLWSGLLAYAGLRLGPAWLSLRDRLHGLDTAVVVIGVVVIVWWLWRRLSQARNRPLTK